MNEATAKALNDLDWSDLHPRLQAHTVRVMRIALGGKTTLDEINGLDKKAFIQEAIKRILEGDRTWNPEKVSLEGFLFGTIRSIISAEAKKYYRKLRHETSTDSEESDSPIASLESNSPSADADSANRELTAIRQKTISALFEEIEDDEELTLVLISLSEGTEKTCAISDETGISPERVSELKRKLKTRLEKVIATNDSLPTKSQLLEVTP
jgi:RNA polymerase sigma factor (sigma-70 family)